VTFTSVLQLNGNSATGIPVPADVVASLGAGRHPKVLVTIGDYTYRTTVSPWGEGYMLPFGADHRAASGLEVGSTVEVNIELDQAPGEIELDADFAAALNQDPAALKCFETLSYSKKQWFIVGVADATKPEAKARRIESYVSMLRDGKTP
jgi:hypothetical protein